MPELPDVEVFRRYVDSTCLYQPIERVRVMEERILEGATPKPFSRRITGQSFESTDRHGKHLFIHLSGGDVLAVHFGMTGWFNYYKSPQDQPQYTYFTFDFQNGYHLAYVIPRKLGSLELIESMEDFVDAKGLGPDVYKPSFGRGDFQNLLKGRRGMIKSTLMNQEIMAGVGNVYSDEILFQTREHPKRLVKDFSPDELEELYDGMQQVLETAIQYQANPEGFPDSWLIPRRSEGEKCPNCDGEIKRIKVAGRAGYFCPSCQAMG